MDLYPDGTLKEKSSDRLVFCSVQGTSTPVRGAANSETLLHPFCSQAVSSVSQFSAALRPEAGMAEGQTPPGGEPETTAGPGEPFSRNNIRVMLSGLC